MYLSDRCDSWAKKVKHLILTSKFTEVTLRLNTIQKKSGIRQSHLHFCILFLEIKDYHWKRSDTGLPKCYWTDAFFVSPEVIRLWTLFLCDTWRTFCRISGKKKLFTHKVKTNYLKNQTAFAIFWLLHLELSFLLTCNVEQFSREFLERGWRTSVLSQPSSAHLGRQQWNTLGRDCAPPGPVSINVCPARGTRLPKRNKKKG